MKERKKKKCVLLEDEMSEDWLQIWTAASLLEVKGNSNKKNFFFSLTGQFSHIRSHIFIYNEFSLS